MTTNPARPLPEATGILPRGGRGLNKLAALIDGWYSDKRRQISRPKLLATVCLFDLIVVVGTGVATAASSPAMERVGIATVLGWSTVVALAMVAVFQGRWSYSIAALHDLARGMRKLAAGALLVFGAVMAIVYVANLAIPSRDWLLSWGLTSFVLLTSVRFLAAGVVDKFSDAGRLVRRTVIAGGGADAAELIRALEASGKRDVHILGVFDDRQDERSSVAVPGLKQLGTFDDLAVFCRDSGVDLIIVTVPRAAEYRLLQILHRFWVLPVDVRLSALNSKLPLHARAYTYIANVPMLAVFDKALTDWERVVKNIADRALAAVLCILAAPVMALVALAIRLDSKGPILFRQKRYGFNNELIEVLKFRSMYVDEADITASRLVTRDDPRVTPVGRFIRRTSLDELPQLFNVLRGELALVGPRPHATQAKADSELYEYAVHGYFARHRVKPGVTGWAQINGWRGETDTKEKLKGRIDHDLYYIENWSVALDLYIVALTPIALITGKNAY